MPHEYQRYGHVSLKTDSFAFAITLIEMVTGLTAFKSREMCESDEIGTNTLVSHPGAIATGWPPGVIAALAPIISRCAEQNARRRSKICEISGALENVLANYNCC